VGSTKTKGDILNFQTISSVDQLHTQNNTINLNNGITNFYTDNLNNSESGFNFEFEIPCYIEQNESLDLNVINSVGRVVFNSVD
jgi:hypothetical protein